MSLGSVGMALPVTSADQSGNPAISSASAAGTLSVPCSTGNNAAHQQQQGQGQHGLQAQHIQIPGTAMTLGNMALALGLSGANGDPNNLTFTSNTLASLQARMGLSSVAGSNSAGLMAPANSLMTFPGSAALNLVPGVSMNLSGGPGGVSIVDGGLSMSVGGMMHAPGNVNVVGVPSANDLSGNNVQTHQQPPQHQHQAHTNMPTLLPNNLHINAGSSNVNMVTAIPASSSGHGHGGGGCCGGCKTRVTVKDMASQTDLSTVIQSELQYLMEKNGILDVNVKAEERLARSGLMPGARLINTQGTTVRPGGPGMGVGMDAAGGPLKFSAAAGTSHHGPNLPCACDFCGRMFAKKEYLRRHIRIHTGERPYKCVICGHSFRRSHHLRCHELTHTGTKPYSCGICGKAFNLSHHLRRHEMTHTGEKPFACTECGKAFTRKQHLDRHYKTHTGDYHRTFKCPFCEKMFFRAHHRDKHMKRHVLTTPDLTTATFSSVNNVALSIRADGTLQAGGLVGPPGSAKGSEESHSSEDYITSDEEGKVGGSDKPKEGSKKRKGTSPMRLRFPYDYTLKTEGGVVDPMKLTSVDLSQMKNMNSVDLSQIKNMNSVDLSQIKNMNSVDLSQIKNMTSVDLSQMKNMNSVDLSQMKNMSFPLPTGMTAQGLSQGIPVSTPTRGRPRGSKNRGGGTQRKKKGDMMQMKTTEALVEQAFAAQAVQGVKEEVGNPGLYGGSKGLPTLTQQMMAEAVVVRHPLQVSLGGPGGQMGQDKGLQQPKQDVSTPAPTPEPRNTPMQWQQQQQQQQQQLQQQQQQQLQQQQVSGLPGSQSTQQEYLTMNRQLHTPGPSHTPGPAPTANGGTEVQQTMHYKPPSTPDQNLQWPPSSSSSASTANWPRISLASEQLLNYNQVADASRFMYSASKAMEQRMAEIRAPHPFVETGQWVAQGGPRREDKGDQRVLYQQ